MTFWNTSKCGNSAKFWNTIAKSRRNGGTAVTRSLRMKTSPSSGCSKPAISRKVVVLPHPDGPSSEKNIPRGIARVSALTAAAPP